jgi:hypothetical protein
VAVELGNGVSPLSNTRKRDRSWSPSEAQPSTAVWFAFRLSETTYGAFAVFAEAPSFDTVDVLEARL